MNTVKSLLTAGLVAAAGMSAMPAAAATYVIDETVPATGLTCNTAHDVETCVSGFQLVEPFVTLNSTDSYTLNLTFSSRLFVPGSKTEDIVFDELIDLGNGGELAPYTSNVSSTFQGYIGPPIGYSAYSSDAYQATAGFGFGSGGLPNGGFSMTGLDSTFDITQSDPNLIIGFFYGYQVAVPEPATWALMIAGIGALGATMRTSRRRIAQRP